MIIIRFIFSCALMLTLHGCMIVPESYNFPIVEQGKGEPFSCGGGPVTQARYTFDDVRFYVSLRLISNSKNDELSPTLILSHYSKVDKNILVDFKKISVISNNITLKKDISIEKETISYNDTERNHAFFATYYHLTSPNMSEGLVIINGIEISINEKKFPLEKITFEKRKTISLYALNC